MWEHTYIWEVAPSNLPDIVKIIRKELLPTLAVFVSERTSLFFGGLGKVYLRTHWKNADSCNSILTSASVTKVLGNLQGKGLKVVGAETADIQVPVFQ